MKKITKLFIILFSIILVSCTSLNSYDPNENITINLLAFNDLHGHVEQNSSKKNGISNASYLVNQIRNEDDLDNTVVVACGDMLQETAISRVSYGRVVIDCMSEMKFDAMILGNHEFDWGIDKVINYFDDDKLNGEASFPLLNANIYDKNNELLAIENDNVLESTLIEKEGIKIGIIGFIGDVYNSINRNMVEDYSFKSKDAEIEAKAYELGTSLKNQGADLIFVGIHGGDTSGVEDYSINSKLAELKYNGSYLIDAVMNGHTHSSQIGSIKRSKGTSLPIVQSQEYSSNGDLNEFGRIDITYNKQKKSVVGFTASHVDVADAKANYDQNVEAIVDNYYDSNKNTLEEVYCTNQKSFQKNSKDLYSWVSALMTTAVDTDIALCNTGAFRQGASTGELGFKEIYNIIPFDNHIIKTTITGSEFTRFMQSNASYEFSNDINIVASKTYTLAIIDYVYFGTYFDDYRNDTYTDTNLILRDLMIMDLKEYGSNSFNITNAYSNINIGKLAI